MNASESSKKHQEELGLQADSQLGYHQFLDRSRLLSQRLEALRGSAKFLTAEGIAKVVNTVRDQNEEPELRASALRTIGPEMGDREESINQLLEVLKDSAQPREVRLAALQVLQMLAFTSPLFMSKRPEFLAALRSIVEDPDARIREAAIEILAMEKDEYVQRRLNEGLDDPSKALVGPAKAVQLLGQDVHAELYPRLREMVQNPPSSDAREEAVRLLAGDPESKELLVGLMTNRGEELKIRTLSAVALQALDPSEFSEQAKPIIIDNTEEEGLRLTGLNGLTVSPGQPSLLGDREFMQSLERLKQESTSDQMKDAVDRYLNRTK